MQIQRFPSSGRRAALEAARITAFLVLVFFEGVESWNEFKASLIALAPATSSCCLCVCLPPLKANSGTLSPEPSKASPKKVTVLDVAAGELLEL